MTKAKTRTVQLEKLTNNDYKYYGNFSIIEELLKDSREKGYAQGKKDAYKEILKKAEATELTDLDDFFDWLEEASE
jgi:hypothetical protein